MNYVPNKYSNQASAYAGMISGITGNLASASSEIARAEGMLNFGKKNNDLLTYNVISSTTAVKAEISQLSSNLSTYSSLISGKAKELDEEARQEYLRWLAYQRRLKKQEEKTKDRL